MSIVTGWRTRGRRRWRRRALRKEIESQVEADPMVARFTNYYLKADENGNAMPLTPE